MRPKAMTVAVILAGLFPIMWGTGTGSEVVTHCGPNGGRHDHRAAAVNVCGACGLSVDAAEESYTPRQC